MRTNLNEWEESLKPHFGHIQLLCEIPLTHLELDVLGNLIRELIKRHGQAKATRRLESEYVRSFALFLAATASHNTDRQYWQVVSDAVGIGIQSMFQLHWGETFLDILKGLKLRAFKDIGGYRFVTPIRMHGGIPAYSLADFFAYIVWPSVKRDAYSTLITEKVLPIMLKRTAVQIAVDSPVTNFLENGGEYAVEFLDNCRKIARLYIQTGEVPSASEVSLPGYVVRAFQQWVDEELENERGKRYRPPRLYLDPWGPDFYLSLPAQAVEGLMATRSYYWRVETQGSGKQNHEHVERVRVRRRGYDLETSEVELPVDHPAPRIIVSYCSTETNPEKSQEAANHVLRRWRLDLLPENDEAPLLVFHPNDGRILCWNQTLPAQDLWLLYPDDIHLRVQGEGAVVEQFPQMVGAWGKLQVQSWDLSKAHALQLTRNGRDVRAPISIVSVPPDPVLAGENLLHSNLDPDEVLVFIGAPPFIRFPIRAGRSVESELGQWRLNIESRWAASPEIHNELFYISGKTAHVVHNESAVDVPLGALIGEHACGTYRISATGPYEMRTELRFRVWPELIFEGLKDYYLPDQDAGQGVTFSILVPESCLVQPQTIVEGLKVQETNGVYQITVQENVPTADLFLVAPLPDSDPIRLPVSVAVPRLRWSLVLGEESSEMKWAATPLKATVDALMQSTSRTLFFDFPIVNELPLTFNIQLVNPETKEVLHKHSKPQKVNYRQTRWRFNLGEFSDTLRALEEQPIFVIQLVIHNSDTIETTTLPVLHLSRTLDIQDVAIEFLEPPTFRLSWIETRPLRNRRVRIWPEWQPWLKAFEIKIPDNIQGELVVADIDLPPSSYRLQFFTAAPWEEKDPDPLPPAESHQVQSITPEEMLVWIREKLESKSDNFLVHFLKACVNEAGGNLARRDDEIQWCYRSLDQASPRTILAFHNWLGGSQANSKAPRDPNSQKAVRISMFRPQNVGKLLKSHPADDPIRKAYLDNFTNISMISPESVLLVLNQDDNPARVIHGLHILVKRESPELLQKVFDLIDKGQLSESDAAELFKLKPDFALPALDLSPESKIKLRMIKQMVKLLPEQDYFVLPDFWVRTDAGWGKIQKIVAQGDQSDLTYFNRRREAPILDVVLRPGHDPEQIKVDLESKSLVFCENSQTLYACIQDDCRYFISSKIKYLRNEHNHAAHMGIMPAFMPIKSPTNLHNPVVYQVEPPENQFS